MKIRLELEFTTEDYKDLVGRKVVLFINQNGKCACEV
jgi:hypothetical protein